MAAVAASATRREPEAAEETQEVAPVVSDVQVGRAIALLRSRRMRSPGSWQTVERKANAYGEHDWRGRWRNSGQWGRFWRVKPTFVPVWTDEQIAVMFDISLNELRRLVAAWNESRVSRVSERELDSMILKFLRREGRWPMVKEFRLRLNNGLPSVRQLGNHRGYMGAQQRMAQKYKLRPMELLTIPNLTVRRDAIEAAGGIARVVQGGTLLQEDDYGKLWRLPGETPKTPAVMVEVVNSTQNPDGTYDHYVLRVPPTMTTAREAVAWTFELTPEELVFEAQS